MKPRCLWIFREGWALKQIVWRVLFLVPFKGVYKGYYKGYYRGLVKYRVPFRVQEGVHTCRKFRGNSGNLKGITNATV